MGSKEQREYRYGCRQRFAAETSADALFDRESDAMGLTMEEVEPELVDPMH